MLRHWRALSCSETPTTDRRAERQRVQVLLDAVDEADVVAGLVEGVRDAAVGAAPQLDDRVVVHLQAEHGRLHLNIVAWLKWLLANTGKSGAEAEKAYS